MKGFTRGPFGDLFQWMVDQCTITEFSLFLLSCWSIWHTRNILVFQCNMSISEMIAKAIRMRGLYCLVPNQIQSSVVETHQIPLWKLPPSSVIKLIIKIIVDASVISSLDHFGVGVIGRDSSGAILCVEGKFLPGSFTPIMAELIAIQHDLLRATSMGWNDIIIESDTTQAVQAINLVHPFSMEDQVVHSICRLSSNVECISVLHSPRSTNQIAHELARRSIYSHTNFVFLNEIHLYLQLFVIKDLRVV